MNKKLVIFALILFTAANITAQNSKNVILITIDTLRADHLSCYGYPFKISPNIDKFSREAVLFKNCRTPSPLTTPGIASILTSKYPHQHGAKRNGLSVFDNVALLQEVFKKNGYKTAGFITNWPLKDKLCGLKRGFDQYYEIFSKKRWYGITRPEGEAEVVAVKVKEWLKNNLGNEPIFLWIHFSEPHAPYIMHDNFKTDFDYSKFRNKYPEGSDFEKIKKYDSEIYYTDFYTGKIFELLKKNKIYKDSLIVLSADHGESFGEHNYFGHGRKLYESCLHVPLIIKFSDMNSSDAKIEQEKVSLLDIVPTILHNVNIKSKVHFEGINLKGFINPFRRLFFEAYKGASLLRHGKQFKRKVKPIAFALIDKQSKLISDEQMKKYEFYNLQTDKFETNNAYKESDSKIGMFQHYLTDYIKKVKAFIIYSRKKFKQKNELSEEDVEKFKALGYLK